MKKNNLFVICAISTFLGLTLSACEKQTAVQQPAAPTSTVAVTNAPAPIAPVASNAASLIGSGIPATQTVALSQPVKSVLADVSATFIYDPSVGNKIVVTADNNIQDQVKVSLERGVLKLAPMASNIQQKTPIQITWGGAAPEQLDIKGSSKIILRQFKGNQLTANISGSGEVDADGQTEQLNIDISGSGTFVGTQLVAQKATIKVAGSGNIVAQVKQEVSGSLTGSGSLVISGNPKSRGLNSTGSAQVVYQ